MTATTGRYVYVFFHTIYSEINDGIGVTEDEQEATAVKKTPRNCCDGQFWPNVIGRRYFADTPSITVTSSACIR